MNGIAQKKFIGRFCLAFVVFLFAFGIFLPSLFAGQSRGIRVVAFDKTSGKNKEVKLYNKSYAVVIGIDQYKNLPFDKQLSYAVKDAKGVAEILEKNFKFDKIITLYNREATKGNIMKVLSGDLSKISEKDSVFVFWAGHGYTEKTSRGDLGYLVPFDGTFEESQLYENISMTMIKDDISKRIPAKHIFYVMDSCYSGLLVAKRGAARKTARDFSYLQEITKEEACQVLTAGSKDQQVLDGGPRGHSVFTGRFIEVLENTDDFITATEISAIVKEKVFSDARTRGHTQTPKYGELFGLGDYVFVPSLERKVEDTQAKLAGLQKEMQRLDNLEKAALKAKDETAQRQAELEKKAVLAKLKAEQLKQERLAGEKKRREQEKAERLRKEQELAKTKKETELKLAALKKDVEAKRKAMGDSIFQVLSPFTAIKQMRNIDAKIKNVTAEYQLELTNAIMSVSRQANQNLEMVLHSKKDEFETEEDFLRRIGKIKTDVFEKQSNNYLEVKQKVKTAYKNAIKPFVKSIINLSKHEYTIMSTDLILELDTYDAQLNVYPVTIITKESFEGLIVTCSTKLSISREEAKVFKQHFLTNILRSEIKGNFQTPDFFRITSAYIIDDSNNQKYDLFSSRFVDIGNGIVCDNKLKILWVKDPQYFGKKSKWEWAQNSCVSLNFAGLAGWRLPTKRELIQMHNAHLGREPHPFNIQKSFYWSATPNIFVNFGVSAAFFPSGTAQSFSGHSGLIWAVHSYN